MNKTQEQIADDADRELKEQRAAYQKNYDDFCASYKALVKKHGCIMDQMHCGECGRDDGFAIMQVSDSEVASHLKELGLT